MVVLVVFVCAYIWYVFIADHGPPKYNPAWGLCYNLTYTANHIKSAEVADPVFVIGDSDFIRGEVYECRDEFVTWINANLYSDVQFNSAMARRLRQYILCRDANGSEKECNH